MGVVWTCLENPRDGIAETNHRLTAGFHTSVGDGLVCPINIVGAQRSHVGLRTAKVPKQFVIVTQLRIAFASQDFLMFFPSDTALVFEFNFRPLPFRNNGPRKPVHGDAKVVKLPQVHVRADRAALHYIQDLLGGRFHDDAIEQGLQNLLVSGAQPSLLGGALFGVDDPFQGLPPAAGGHP